MGAKSWKRECAGVYGRTSGGRLVTRSTKRSRKAMQGGRFPETVEDVWRAVLIIVDRW